MLSNSTSLDLLLYMGVSSVVWIAILFFIRFFVFQKSVCVPVFRITPDRREVRENMETCEWLQVIVQKYFASNIAGTQPSELKASVSEVINRFMHLSGGKFELHTINIGDTPPQLCGIECRREGSGKTVILADIFYHGAFSSLFSVEYPVQLPLLGTSMFPIKVGIESVDIQLRIKLVWDHREHTLGPSHRDSDCSKPLRFPSNKTSIDISLANIPDVAIKLRTEIGARHVITDSQVITSILAGIARRRLQSHVIYPNCTTVKFKIPDVVAPPTGVNSPREEDLPPRSLSPVGVLSESSDEPIHSRNGSNDMLEATLTGNDVSSLDGWANGKEVSVPPVHLSVLRDHADGLSRVSLLTKNAINSSTPNDKSQLGGSAVVVAEVVRRLASDSQHDSGLNKDIPLPPS
eukprot:TRINITY_DN484_c4_g1_i1.p1 TRINITY_DN484_c4_g1~~TRINITY_DN484_c4_g1_i1.p1  ORF type:complete len:438 (+),score=66.87 TRINITY_DN484_c4_g1_i1:97-1314(+)